MCSNLQPLAINKIFKNILFTKKKISSVEATHLTNKTTSIPHIDTHTNQSTNFQLSIQQMKSNGQI